MAIDRSAPTSQHMFATSERRSSSSLLSSTVSGGAELPKAVAPLQQKRYRAAEFSVVDIVVCAGCHDQCGSGGAQDLARVVAAVGVTVRRLFLTSGDGLVPNLGGGSQVDLLDLLPRRGQGVPVRAALRAVVGEMDQGALWQEVEGFIEEAERIPRLVPSVATKAASPEAAAEDLLGQVGTAAEPVEVEAVARACAVPVLEWPFDDAVSGLVVETDDGAVIGVNERRYLNRRRFSLGHELGHVVLRHLETFHLDLGVAALDGTPPNYNWRHEQAANDFAAALLMPADLVRRAHGESPHLSTLAERFKVSRIAMGFRMKALDVT